MTLHRGKRAGFPGYSGGFFPRQPSYGGFFGSDTGGSSSPSNSAPTAGFTWTQTVNTRTIVFTDTSTDSDGTIASWAWDFGDAGTSTSQNPSHSYSAAGTYTVQLTVTDNGGATNNTSTTVRVVAIDGAANVFTPSSAADFTALGLTAPSSLWLCQEASGNAADSIGAVTLTAGGTPLYSQAVAGWTRVGFGFNQTANQRFSVGAGTYDPSASSQAILLYAKADTVSGTPRALATLGQVTGNNLYCAFTSAGLVRIVNFAVINNGAVDHRGAVHPYLFVYNRTAGTVRVYTDAEQINGTYNATVTDGNKGLCANGLTSFAGQTLWAAQWSGAAAEALNKTTLQALGWTVAY